MLNLYWKCKLSLLKKIFFILVLSFLTCMTGLTAFADIKINNVSFDSSNKFMFLSTTGTPSTEQSVDFVTLKNPNRVFFDIKGAILTQPNETWFFRSSDITQIRVSQFSTNPNIVRVVFYHDAKFNPKNISLVNVKGNYLFKFGNVELSQTDFLPAYRETRSEKYDFLEKMVYIPSSQIVQNPIKTDLSTINAQTVQKAFANVTEAATKPAQEVQTGVPTNFSWSKIFKVRTRYYISRVDVKRGNILLLGSGNISVEKPFILTNPTRVVYDLPNTILAQRFRNIEIQLSDNETLKIAQFEPSKVRMVITTPSTNSYRPIFSSDMQGMLLGHDYRLSGIKLYEKGAQTLSYNSYAETALTDVFQINYAAPIVHSIKRDGNKIELKIYNATGFNDDTFKKAVQGLKSTTVTGEKMSIGGVQYVFTTSPDSVVETFVREDGKQLRIRIKNKKQETKAASQPAASKTSGSGTYKGSGLIVIDPGHGGVDAGAIRAGINEKDINLDISKMIAQILVKKGYKVDMTRWDDKTVSLQGRVDFADSRKASVFVSIHTNSSVREEPQGIETHWWTDEGHELAKVVHASFASKVKATDRGLVQSRFYVINHTKAKSILVEVGFISNDKERNQLISQERKQQTAEGIAEGIIKFMKSEAKK